MKVRRPAVAGQFYSGRREDLMRKVMTLLQEGAKISVPGKLKALVVPHAGYDYSGIVAASGFRLLSDQDFKIFLVLGPSHFFSFQGASLSVCDFWETPLGQVKVARRQPSDLVRDLPEAHVNEHSLEVQLPFLQMLGKQFEIVPILTGEIKPEILAAEIVKFLTPQTFVIVSSDLSHYYPYEKAVSLDRTANQAVPSLDYARAEAEVEACGKTAILTLMQLARQLNWKGQLIDYKNSGDTSGDKRQVVGYGCYAFYEPNLG
jgi:AmmeMemoRadiSam system protein B